MQRFTSRFRGNARSRDGGGDWRDRSYGLTGTGKSTALETLRTRASGPRTIPWP